MLHDKLTREIREGASGPKIAAFFDVDRTLLAGFSAVSFMRERITSGRVGPTELAQSLLGTLSFALGRTGFSGFVSAHTQAYRGSTWKGVADETIAIVWPRSRCARTSARDSGKSCVARCLSNTSWPSSCSDASVSPR